jgi:hypothetical protein
MKLCQDCAHLGDPTPTRHHQPACMAPQARTEPDPIDGSQRPLGSAYMMRAMKSHCGRDAAWFEQRPAHRPTWWARLLGEKPYSPPQTSAAPETCANSCANPVRIERQ